MVDDSNSAIQTKIQPTALQPLTAGHTALHHKAAALVHMIRLEAGGGDAFAFYCSQVIATISDQGLFWDRMRQVHCHHIYILSYHTIPYHIISYQNTSKHIKQYIHKIQYNTIHYKLQT